MSRRARDFVRRTTGFGETFGLVVWLLVARGGVERLVHEEATGTGVGLLLAALVIVAGLVVTTGRRAALRVVLASCVAVGIAALGG